MTTNMTRRQLLTTGAAALGASLFAPMVNRNRYRVFAQVPRDYSARTVELMERTTVVDMLHGFGGGSFLSDPDTFTEEELRKYRESNVNVFHITTSRGGPDPYQTVVASMARMNGFIARHHRDFRRITSGRDLEELHESGRIGIIIGFQDSRHFRTLDDIDFFHGLGQRVSQLTYNSQNRIGSGAMDRTDSGLSDFGVDVVERMNQVGMTVDVAHGGDRTIMDAFEASSKPVIISHANARALVPGYSRNVTDEALRRMSAQGGVIGLTSVRSFVHDREPTTIENLLDHYEHVARLVGVEHVGIGSDHTWEGYDATPEPGWSNIGGRYREQYRFRHKIDMDEMTHPRRTYEIVEGLVDRGWSDADVELVLGGNFVRVLTETWDVAERSTD